MEAESFIQHPIIFGDFLKMGAAPADKMYEELTDLNKLQNVLQDVSVQCSKCSECTVCSECAV